MASLTVFDRWKNAFNFFRARDPTERNSFPANYGVHVSSSVPFNTKLSYATKDSIANPVFNRIAIDCASIEIKHVRLDDLGRYSETIDSPLNECLTLSANDDQTGAAFIQDAVFTMLEKGHVVIVPELTDTNPEFSDGIDIYSVRVGYVTDWSPDRVRIKMYNSLKGYEEECVVPKRSVAIVQNPLYSVMNSPNSTFSRLKHKMALLDRDDDRFSDGKLDLIIQLPYITKTKLKEDQAKKRLGEITQQLRESPYGIAYTDGTEKITQLNRAIENNLQDKVAKLREEFFAEIGFSENILNGTAEQTELVNYNNKIVEPIVKNLVDEMKRKFLSPTARSKTYRQTIMYFRRPFRMATVEQFADLGEVYCRNEVMTPNELRQELGLPPSTNPDSDVLRNRNMPMADEGLIPYDQQALLDQQMADPNAVPIDPNQQPY